MVERRTRTSSDSANDKAEDERCPHFHRGNRPEMVEVHILIVVRGVPLDQFVFVIALSRIVIINLNTKMTIILTCFYDFGMCRLEQANSLLRPQQHHLLLFSGTDTRVEVEWTLENTFALDWKFNLLPMLWSWIYVNVFIVAFTIQRETSMILIKSFKKNKVTHSRILSQEEHVEVNSAVGWHDSHSIVSEHVIVKVFSLEIFLINRFSSGTRVRAFRVKNPDR